MSSCEKEKIEKVSEKIHIIWMRNNDGLETSKPELFLPYNQLAEDEKQKDRDAVLPILKLKKENKTDEDIIEIISEKHHTAWYDAFQAKSTKEEKQSPRIRKGNSSVNASGNVNVDINQPWSTLGEPWKIKQRKAVKEYVDAFNEVFNSKEGCNLPQSGGRKTKKRTRKTKKYKKNKRFVSLKK